MLHAVPIEVWLAAAYALFLMGVAAVLERLAVRAHRRSEQYEVAGFKFHQDCERWECPTGQLLHRSETDHRLRVIRYKAPAHACNACHLKARCTDSHSGREIEQPMDSWLRSEIGRFHQVISLALLLLAATLLAIEAARFPRSPSVVVLAIPVLPIGVAALRLASVLLHPSRSIE